MIRKRKGKQDRTKRSAIPWHIYLTIGIGSLVIGAMACSLYIGNRVAVVYAPLVDAVMEIKYETAIGHLWLEEVITGDREENIAEVLGHFETALWYNNAMLEGGESPEGKFIALDDPQFRQENIITHQKIKELLELAKQRFQQREVSGIGTEIDQRYDALFKDLIQHADKIESRLQKIMRADISKFRQIQTALIAVVAALAVLIGVTMHAFDRRRTKDFQEVQSEKQKALDLAKFPSENPGPVLRVKTGGKIMYANDAGKALLDSWKTEVGNTAPEKWRSLITQACASEKGIIEEEGVENKTLLLAIAPVKEAGYVNLYGRDITDRKKAERQLQQNRDNLEVMVDRRTTELTAVNKELEAFAYSVSHDLRAPLRGIDGFSRALLEECADELDDTGKDYLSRVRAASQRMGQLIEDILNLSRLTRCQMHHEDVCLGAIVGKIAERLKEAEPDRNVNFVIDPEITVTGDSALLEVVMENLLGNAWKFTSDHEKACIEFGAKTEDQEKIYFVRDDGAGFDMTYSGKLFGAFQRFHRQDEFAGTGIGLATVQRIINRHGGRIWAEGETEKGAVFYFTL